MLKKALQNLGNFINEAKEDLSDVKEALDFILLNKPMTKKKKLKYDEYKNRIQKK